MFYRTIFLIPVLFSLGGCIASVDGGPERLYPVEAEQAALRQALPLPDLTHHYNELDRNDYITARMYAIDLAYTAYFENLTRDRQLGTLGGDLAIVGLGAATSVIPGAATKAALGAATTAIGGARSNIDKDVFVQQTVQILQNQMETSRDSIRTRILLHMGWHAANYTMAQGLSDLEDYYRAGTLAGALEAVSASVGNTAQLHKEAQNSVGVQLVTPRKLATVPPP